MTHRWRELLFRPPSLDDVITVLRAWRWWVLMGVLGALLGAVAFWVVPSPYRARAEVVVDYNLEQAVPAGTDRQLFYFLGRENKKLRDLAFSDAVFQRMAEKLGRPVDPAWRTGMLLLREEKDGAWHFWAEAESPQEAQALAAVWAEAFVEVTREKVSVARRIQSLWAGIYALRDQLAALDNGCAIAAAALEVLPQWAEPQTPWEAWRVEEVLAWLDQSGMPLPLTTDGTLGPEAIQAAQAVAQDRLVQCKAVKPQLEQQEQALQEQLDALIPQSGGLSPRTEVVLSQTQSLPVQRVASRTAFILTGALMGVLVAFLLGLFWGGRYHA